MVSFNLKPSEEFYEIEMEGSFIPSKFQPMWFVKNGLLGKEEAESTNLIKADKDILSFSTKFIKITVENERFAVATAQILSFDLVVDMAVSVSEILKDSIDNIFSIDLMLHFTFTNKTKFRQALNKICGGEKWIDYLKKPQSLSFSITDEIKNRETNQSITIAAEPCERKDMKYTLHLFVINYFEITNKKLSVWDILKEDNHTLKDSIELINKIIDLNFKNK